MKRVALILTLIGLLFAACSPIPEDPAPLSGVIDLTGFPDGMNEAYLEFRCIFGDFDAELTASVYGLSGELDLDAYRPDCTNPIPIYPGELPQELIDAGLDKLTGSRLVYINLSSDDSDWMYIWPKAPAGAQVMAVFYANDGGAFNYTGSHPILVGSISTSIGMGMDHYTADFTYSPGWNALVKTTEVIGFDNNVDLDVVPLHTLEWVELYGSSA